MGHRLFQGSLAMTWRDCTAKGVIQDIMPFELGSMMTRISGVGNIVGWENNENKCSPGTSTCLDHSVAWPTKVKYGRRCRATGYLY